jgi:type 1 glutamine amidotransferase
VVVLYSFRQKLSNKGKANFLKLLQRGVGLVAMHHAVAAYPGWEEYEKIIGATYSLKKGLVRNGMKYMRPVWKHDVDFNVRIEDKNHPITKGMKDFKLNDESYRGWVHHPGSHVLLTTDQKLNNHRLAWTRFYKKARVMFIQLGHGKHAFQSKDFQQLTAQGIRWAGGKLPAGPGADSRKIVFLWSKGKNPNEASAKLLAGCLKNAINAPEIKVEVHENWPADASTLNDAAAIVSCSEIFDEKTGRRRPNMTPEQRKQMRDLASKGLGLVAIFRPSQLTAEAPKMLDGSRASPDHPISRGWKKFALAEDKSIYHSLKNLEGTQAIPILTIPLTSDGKGKAAIACAVEHKNGPRSFAFGVGRATKMWENENCRRMMLNGILWAAKIQVPFDGVQTKLPVGK